MAIKIGVAGSSGLGNEKGVQHAKDLGLDSLEVEFTYGVNMSNETAKKVGELAKKLGISLSVHAPYYINLNSTDKKKRKESKQRILQSCERAHYLHAKYVVFHAGFYGKDDPEKTYQAIKEGILELLSEIKKRKWDVYLAPETTGKVNVFGSLKEILRLVKETKCKCCIDFAHLYAKSNGKLTYNEMCKEIKHLGHIHAHFSGINYTGKGERNHELTNPEEIKKLLEALKKNHINDICIINESPNPFGDAVKTKNQMQS